MSTSNFSKPEALALELILACQDLLTLQEKAGEYYYEDVLLKRSLTGDSDSGPCEDCDGNEAEGWIDSEDVYPSGDDGPPYHPNCVCEEEYKESRRRVYT